jgi:hypothetical protein
MNDLNPVTVADSRRIPFGAPHDFAVQLDCQAVLSQFEGPNQIGHGVTVLNQRLLPIQCYLQAGLFPDELL